MSPSSGEMSKEIPLSGSDPRSSRFFQPVSALSSPLNDVPWEEPSSSSVSFTEASTPHLPTSSFSQFMKTYDEGLNKSLNGNHEAYSNIVSALESNERLAAFPPPSYHSVIESAVQTEPIIVVDVGSLNVRFGISPRGCLANEYSLITPQNVLQPWENIDSASLPIQSGVIVNWNAVEEMFADAVTTKFPLEYSNYSYLLCESQMSPPKQFIEYGEMLFEVFDAQAICFKDPETLVALLAMKNMKELKNLTAILVDMGASLTRIMPIVSGILLTDLSVCLNLGGRDIDQLIFQQWQERPVPSKQTSTSLNAARKEKETLARVAESSEDFRMESCVPIRSTGFNDLNMVNHAYAGATGNPLSVSHVAAPEIFFNSSLQPASTRIHKISSIRCDRRTLPHIIFDIIQRCPIDFRREIYNNLIIYGGTSVLPGMVSRIQKEVQACLLSMVHTAKKRISVTARTNLTRNLRMNAAWSGGYLFAQQSMFDEQKITKNEYEEQGSHILALMSKVERLKHYFLEM
ncbi:actin-like family protein [Cardiosporidium cionae]|uniref:Actin-like family protein n=1 Tax=Cardiosporidium cionae TaxID=476202 RepID=A0ABQ7JBT9_9APIC|nr:actin-like family protein [Cardiosporidium cionae]|eukprot:KAF8821431.1 actin-like family protein [Cardiosporidium cionae]